MSHDPNADVPSGAGISRRRLLANLGLLTLVGIAGTSLLTPDEAEAGKKKRKKTSKKKSRGIGKKVRRIAKKKRKGGIGKKVRRIARKRKRY